MKKTIAALLLFAAGCSPDIRVYSDYDADYNLDEYATFNWEQNENIELGNNPLYYNELNDKRIKYAVKDQLVSKGYLLTEKNPDVIVHYHIIVDDQSIITSDPHEYFYSPNLMHLRTTVHQYREGTLIVDIMDPKTKNLIWRGWAVSALEEKVYTPNQIDVLIKKAVSKIFKKFPKMINNNSKSNGNVVFN